MSDFEVTITPPIVYAVTVENIPPANIDVLLSPENNLEITTPGPQGIPGPGVPIGGTTNQSLTKVDGTNYNTEWSTIDKTFVGLGNVQNLDQTNPSNIVQDSTHRFVSDSEKAIWNAKQNALGFTPENEVNKVTNFNSPNNTTYPTTQAVVDLIDANPFSIKTEQFPLVNTDITNKFVTLAQNPILPQSVSMFIEGGINQRNSVDFQIIGNQCSWSGLGLDGFLSSGDVLIMQYQ